MARAFILLVWVFLSEVTFSQTSSCNHNIQGTVESIDGEALPSASIRVEKNQALVTTDTSGKFSIASLCGDIVTLYVTYVGFESTRIVVSLPTEEVVIIRLTPSVKVLHDFVFEGTHSDEHDNAQSIDILSGADLLSQKGKSLGDMAQQLSGVTSLSSGPGISKPVIQGLHSQRILILNNGVKQEGQQWGVEHAPEIDSHIASDIEVVKGSETIRYGADAIGGVMIVRAPDLRYSSGHGGDISSSFNSNSRVGTLSAMMEGSISRLNLWAWRMQGSVKKGGDFHTPDYTMSNTGVHEINASASIGRKTDRQTLEFYFSTFNTEIGILRSSHTGNLSDLESSIRESRPWYVKDFTYSIENPRQKIAHNLAKISFNDHLTSTLNLNIQYAGQLNQRREFDIRRSSQNDKPSLSLELFSHTLDVAVDKRYASWKVTAGAHAAFKNNNNVLSIGILPDYRHATSALYLIGKKAWQKWNFEWGIRSEYQYLQVLTFNADDELVKPDYNFLLNSFSSGTTVRIGSSSRISSHASYSARPPHTSELFSIGLHHSAGAIEEGLLIEDGQLRSSVNYVKQEKSLKWINTYYYTSDWLSLEVSGHINLLRDYIYLSPRETRLTIRGFFPVFQYQRANALLTGGEATALLDLSSSLRYKSTASFLYAENISDDDRLPMIPPAQFDQTLTWSLPDVARWKNTFVRLNVPLVLKQGRAPRTVYPSEVREDSQNSIFDFMDAPETYVLLNLYVGTEIPFEESRMSIVLGCNNLLNERYRSYMNRLRYFSDEPGRNFSIRLFYTFQFKQQ
jgi:iron complex outermembrane receptor protein